MRKERGPFFRVKNRFAEYGFGEPEVIRALWMIQLAWNWDQPGRAYVGQDGNCYVTERGVDRLYGIGVPGDQVEFVQGEYALVSC